MKLKKFFSWFMVIALCINVFSCISPISANAAYGDLKWPVPSSSCITSCFGEIRGSDTHKGIDITRSTSSSNVEVQASASGTVTAANSTDSWGGGYGYYVRIQHNINGKTLITTYNHLASVSVSANQTVSAGTKVGIMGTTGDSTGIHTHYEVRDSSGNFLDPADYLEVPSDVKYTGTDAVGSTNYYLNLDYIKKLQDRIPVASGPSTLGISGYNTPPSTLNPGQAHSIYGTVSSNYLVKSVTVRVVNSAGTSVTSKTAYPESRSYSIANLDQYITFDKLASGSYRYQVIAKDASGTSKTLVNSSFTVGSVASTLKISNYNTPTTLNPGQAYSIYGTVSSNYNITSVNVKVVNTSGTTVTGKTAYPNAKSYSIANLDQYITFDKLASGSYRYQVIAKDASSTSKTLVNSSFTVRSGSVVPTPAPTSAVTKKGIDVSSHNGTVDWAKVKAAGMSFAIIRCGFGDNISSQDDTQFENNVSGCIANGIPYAVYFYSYAKNSTGNESVDSEIAHAKRLLNGKNPFCVYYDMEESNTTYLGKTTLTNYAVKFCEALKSSGYTVGIYANTNWFNNYLDSSKLYNCGYSLWVADYRSSCGYTKTSYDIWQYSSTSRCNGVNGDVDMNYMYNSPSKMPVQTVAPTSTIKPTTKPTSTPTAKPTIKPTIKPTAKPTSTPTKINVTYQVYDNTLKKWLPNVTNTQDYAGIYGHNITGIYANLSSGNITYKVHNKGGSWLPAVTNRSDYAGILSKPIDGLMMTTNTGRTIHYQVHLKSSNKWLPYVTGYNQNDSNNGYAGVLGQEIDAVRIYID